MSFRSVFIAIVIGFALIVAAFMVNRQRPKIETDQPNASLVRATGKCAECHLRQQYSVVHEYEMSRHGEKGVTCLDCHQPGTNQQSKEHNGFTITAQMTSGNCRSCHEGEYQEFQRSRHAAVSWAAVYGAEGLSTEQVSYAEKYQPGYANRPPHPFVKLEGMSAMVSGCAQCHSVGKPNPTVLLARAQLVTPGTQARSKSHVCRAPVLSVTWDPITLRSKSMKSLVTAFCLKLNASNLI